MRYKKIQAFMLILLSLSVLAACKGQANVEPTVDPNTIYTAAVMTVEAQLTQAALQNPSPTNTEPPPTQAVPPTQALQSTSAEQGQQAPGQPLVTSTTFVLPTFTATPPPPSAQAKYELVSQNPADQTVLAPNQKFDMVWTIKNTGTETWTEQYTIEFFLGDRIGAGHYTITRYNFRETVAPGKSTSLIVDMMTPAQAGEYYSWWKLKDHMGNNFGDLDVRLIVSAQATP